jgi:hypothetical protein
MAKKKRVRRAEQHTITISLDEDNNLTVSPTSLFAGRRDRVSWECAEGGFLVSFRETPFAVVNIDQPVPGVTRPLPFRGDVTPGVYHYAVVVGEVVEARRAHGVRLTMTAGCPEIIIGG